MIEITWNIPRLKVVFVDGALVAARKNGDDSTKDIGLLQEGEEINDETDSLIETQRKSCVKAFRRLTHWSVSYSNGINAPG